MISKILDQDLGKLKLSGQTSPPSVFGSSDLLEHTTSIHLLIVYGSFHATTAELNSCDRGAKPKIFTIRRFIEKVCQSLI